MNRTDCASVAEKIRMQYTKAEKTELDTLRELDARVKRPANVFAYVFGSIAAIVMGSGMSLVMTDIGTTIGLQSAMLPGVIVGLVGMTLALLNYPIYCGILEGRKKKYGEKILALSERIMNK